MNLVGVDIGGTHVKLGLFNSKGKMMKSAEYMTENEKSSQYIIEKLISQISLFHPFDAIGISVAGHVNREEGMINHCTNIPSLTGAHLQKQLTEYFHVPVSLENDVNAAAIGECTFGIGQQYEDFLFLTYGTGIGGAIVQHSQLVYGKQGYAGEFGHMVIERNGARCNCGQKGCYEAYGSTTALIRQAVQLNPAYSNGKIIFEKMQQGDKMLRQIVENWVDDIVVGLITLINIFNPSALILGGGVMEQEEMIEWIEKKIHNNVKAVYHPVTVVRTALGNKAGMLGAIAKYC